MRKKAAGYFFIFLSALIFSTTELTLKSVSGAFAPLQLTAFRFLIGGICLIPFALSSLKGKGRRLHAADLGFFWLMGFLFVVLSMVVYQMAILRTKASAVAVLFSCNALFATLLAAVFLKEKLKRKHFIALAFEVAAVIVIAAPWQQALDLVGVILALASAVLYAVYLVAGKKRSSELGGVAITCGSALCGSLLLFGLILIGRIPAVSSFFTQIGLPFLADVPLTAKIVPAMLPALLYLVFIITAGGNVFQMLAVELTSARDAALIFFLKPMLAPLLAWLLIGEAITLNMGAGIVLFLIGSAVALWG